MFSRSEAYADDTNINTCINCNEGIERQVYISWIKHNVHLCSDCLMNIHESIFGNFFPNESDIKGYKKKTISNRIKWDIWQRDDFTCQYCGSRSELAIDHIYPESRGGELTEGNLVTACKYCNSKKGKRTPEEAGMVLINDPR